MYASRWKAPPPSKAQPECDYNHDMCKAWANTGQCKKNLGFMAEDYPTAVGFLGLAALGPVHLSDGAQRRVLHKAAG